MKDRRFDAIDRRILRRLQVDGRISNADLADAVGITAPPCLRRRRALERDEIIRGYHADLDPDKLGYPTAVFMRIALKEKTKDAFDAFLAAIDPLPEIRECHKTTGAFDFLLRLSMSDFDAYDGFLKSLRKLVAGIEKIEADLAIERVLWRPGLNI